MLCRHHKSTNFKSTTNSILSVTASQITHASDAMSGSQLKRSTGIRSGEFVFLVSSRANFPKDTCDSWRCGNTGRRSFRISGGGRGRDEMDFAVSTRNGFWITKTPHSRAGEPGPFPRGAGFHLSVGPWMNVDVNGNPGSAYDGKWQLKCSRECFWGCTIEWNAQTSGCNLNSN